MNITTHLNDKYWLSISAIQQNTGYSKTAIRTALLDTERGGVVLKRIGKFRRHYFKTTNYQLFQKA